MLNEALKMVRLFHRQNQVQVSQGTGLSKSYISEIESGRKKVSMDVLEKYASYFSMPLSSLLFFAEQSANQKAGDDIREVVAEKVIKMLDWLVSVSEFDKTVDGRGKR
ncbi:MAG: helix-turn-helix transcriptional regulator [Magnetococcales bacterium]|nr:helix-turn-helix transcriptional regulator [Magnetococcales bacterium]MBF0322489.1 helix-turn-helix transcriptional regulator [Magnetococcales bacterium]